MDSSKIISLEDLIKKENRFPSEEEALEWAIQLCDLLQEGNGSYRLLNARNIYVENDATWSVAQPPLSNDSSDALFRLGSVLHHILTREPFRISHYLDGPPAVRERNPQISVRLESIAMRLLQNVRALRYSSVQELREDLLRLQKELAGDWPVAWSCFKGNGSRTNSVADEEFQPEEKTLKELWKCNIGEVWASPVVAGEYLFVGASDGKFYGIEVQSGKIMWSIRLGARIESTACLAGNVAYLGDDAGRFVAINIKSGAVLWKRALGEYIRSSAYCDRTHVYVGSIQQTQRTGMLWCLSRESGEVVWKRNIGPTFGSPVVERDLIVIGSDDERVYCFNSSGVEKWKTTVGGKIRSTPAGAREFVFAGGFGGVLCKIRKTNGEIVWRNTEAGSMYSSPAHSRRFVVVGNNSGVIGYFQPSTGKKTAEFHTGGPVTASPLIVNQFVLVGSNDGFFHVLNSEGQSVCSFNAQSPINSSACYFNRTIYVGSDSGLHALGF